MAILVSRSGKDSTKSAHDEPASTSARGEVSPPIPRTPGVTISTSAGRRSPGAASHEHDTRAAAASDGKSRSTPVPNEGASLLRETSTGPRGSLPSRTLPTPAESESQRDVHGPWAKLQQHSTFGRFTINDNSSALNPPSGPTKTQTDSASGQGVVPVSSQRITC